MSDASQEMLDRWMTSVRDRDDAEAYHCILEHCHGVVRSVLLRKTASPDLADEISQEVFVRAWIARSQYRPGTNPKAWFFSIANHLLADQERHHTRHQRHRHELIRHELLRRSTQCDGEEDEGGSQRADALQGCLSCLEGDKRQLIDLVHGQGFSTSDAAEAAGIHPPTCRKRLSRIQQALRECVQTRLGEAQ